MVATGIEAAYFNAVGVGEYLGIVRPIPGDRDPGGTFKRQLDKIYQMVKRGTIPHIKRGRRLYFEKRVIDEWMREGMRTP